MKKKIVIVGSTGNLGASLLKYSFKNNIKIFATTYFNNSRLALLQKKKYKIDYCFSLKFEKEKINFLNFLKNNKIHLIYFLDYGSSSLLYTNIFLKNNTNSIIAIANKELIIAGGLLLFNLIKKTKNNFIPLDSEHFSLLKFKENIKSISKIYITASGGPFYFKKKIDLNKVSFNEVINHPKWKMGYNNSIDSSNFINKYLEMLELSFIFNLSLDKIDFLISKNAYVHSVAFFKDGSINFNCFENNMLISLIYPLRALNCDLIDFKINEKKIFDYNNFKICKFDDKRFELFKYLKKLKSISHKNMIKFMILNNIAHRRYINNEIKYHDIVPFILKRIDFKHKNEHFRSFNATLKYIELIKKKYE